MFSFNIYFIKIILCVIYVYIYFIQWKHVQFSRYMPSASVSLYLVHRVTS